LVAQQGSHSPIQEKENIVRNRLLSMKPVIEQSIAGFITRMKNMISNEASKGRRKGRRNKFFLGSSLIFIHLEKGLNLKKQRDVLWRDGLVTLERI